MGKKQYIILSAAMTAAKKNNTEKERKGQYLATKSCRESIFLSLFVLIFILQTCNNLLCDLTYILYTDDKVKCFRWSDEMEDEKSKSKQN